MWGGKLKAAGGVEAGPVVDSSGQGEFPADLFGDQNKI